MPRRIRLLLYSTKREEWLILLRTKEDCGGGVLANGDCLAGGHREGESQ